MAILPREKMPQRPIEIDLTGPEGNAYVLMGKAENFYKQLGHSRPEIEALITEMKSSDYDHLLDVFEREFGSFVTLYR